MTSERKRGIMTNQKELISAADLIETHKEPTRWLLEGLVPKVGVVAISGGSNCGKTWVGLEMAIDFASGGTFLGQACSETSAALYLSQSDNLQVIAERVQALCRGKGGEVPGAVYFDQSSMDFSEEPGLNALGVMVRQTKCKILIIDNFRQYLPKMADHSGYWVGNCMGNLRELCEREQICIAILHQNDRAWQKKEERYSRASHGMSEFFARCDLLMDLNAEYGLRTLVVQKNRLNEVQKQYRFSIFSEEDEFGEALSYLILLEEPRVVVAPKRMAEQAKRVMRLFLSEHKGERFGRKDLIEALEAVMPLPRQRNLSEAFAELGKDQNVKTVFVEREKFYCWDETFYGYGEKVADNFALDAQDSPEKLYEKLEALGQRAVRRAVDAGMDEKTARAMVKEEVI
jgi:archaellum biogenesis ATPase FlaH